MSCDYWRSEYWRRTGKLPRLPGSGGARGPNGDGPNWVKEDIVQEIVESVLEDDLEDLPVPESTRRKLQRTRASSSLEYSLEVTYRRAKHSARTDEKRWTQEERNSVAKKTRKLLRRIRLTGLPENASPVHGKKGLPRISSQAGYAAVYDLLVKMGCNLDSVFDTVYDAAEDSKDLTSKERQEIVRLVEIVEKQTYKGSESDMSSIVEATRAVRAISTKMFDSLMQVFEELSLGREMSLEMRNMAREVLAEIASFAQAG